MTKRVSLVSSTKRRPSALLVTFLFDTLHKPVNELPNTILDLLMKYFVDTNTERMYWW